ncbi:hypothetical protein Plhal304r1_c046g0126881 [Plasmopara halstedii]
MTYSPEQYQANKERINAAQKRYYQRTRDARLSYQKATTTRIETRFELVSVSREPNLTTQKANLMVKPNLTN